MAGNCKHWLPLYLGLGQKESTPFAKPETANTGLLFDKFCDIWSGPEKWEPEVPPKGDSVRLSFLKEIRDHLNEHPRVMQQLGRLHERRQKLLAKIEGKELFYKTSWRFIPELGMGHVLETGFVWHRTLGVPYLPGSSIKGMMRAWAEQWKGVDTANIAYLFGNSDENGAGHLIVFDALPTTCPKLELDIMTPHYGPYYVDPEHNPPADYYSPTPIPFLAVAADQEFEFAIAHRNPNKDPQTAKDNVAKGIDLLKEALSNIGAGGKTAVGYGQFKNTSDTAGKDKVQTYAAEEETEEWEDVFLSWTPSGGGILTASGNNRKATVQGDNARKIIATLDESSIHKLTHGKKRKSVPVKKVTVKKVGNAFVVVGVDNN